MHLNKEVKNVWEYKQGPESNDYLKHYGVKGMKWDPEKLKRKGQYAYDAAKGGYMKVKKDAKAAVQKAYGKTAYGKADLKARKYDKMAKAADRQGKAAYDRGHMKTAARYAKAYGSFTKSAAKAADERYKASPSYKLGTAIGKGIVAGRKAKASAQKAKTAARVKGGVAFRKALSATGTTSQYHKLLAKGLRAKSAVKKKANPVISKAKETAKYVKNTPARIKGKQELKAFVKKQKRNNFYAQQAAQVKRNKTTLKKREQDRKQRGTTQKRIRG